MRLIVTGTNNVEAKTDTAVLFAGFGHDLAVKLESIGITVYAGCLLPTSDGAKKLR